MLKDKIKLDTNIKKNTFFFNNYIGRKYLKPEHFLCKHSKVLVEIQNS